MNLKEAIKACDLDSMGIRDADPEALKMVVRAAECFNELWDLYYTDPGMILELAFDELESEFP